MLLTDPPQLPPGTGEHLYLTYSGVSLNVTSPGGSNQVFSASFSGTVDLTTLTNLTQTVASIRVPAGWRVTGVALIISGMHMSINGTVQGVTPITSTISIPVTDSYPLNESIAGSIMDFNPVVELVQVVNATSGQTNNAFIFIPGGVAVGETRLNQSQTTVGTVSNLTSHDFGRLHRLAKLYSQDLSVTSFMLHANENMTTFNVTLHNNGSVALPIYGFNLRGLFNMTTIHFDCNKNGKVCHESSHTKIRNSTIPFWINGTSLVPVLGSLQPGGSGTTSIYMLGANQSATFNFTGYVQALKQFHRGYNHIVISPVNGDVYRLTVVGIGRARFHIQAT